LEGKILACRLPAYAPELNPVEYWPAPSGAALRAACGRRSRSARFRACWKQHELPNLCARDLWSLSELNDGLSSALSAAVGNSSANSNGVDTLSMVASDPPTAADLDSVVQKLNELIAALRR
jgi:hypothetical protein